MAWEVNGNSLAACRFTKPLFFNYLRHVRWDWLTQKVLASFLHRAWRGSNIQFLCTSPLAHHALGRDCSGLSLFCVIDPHLLWWGKWGRIHQSAGYSQDSRSCSSRFPLLPLPRAARLTTVEYSGTDSVPYP